MITITLNKQMDRKGRIFRRILGGPKTKERLAQLKETPKQDLRKLFRNALLVQDSKVDGSYLSPKALDFFMGYICELGSELREEDKRYKIDTGVSVIRGIDNNFEIGYSTQAYHFSAVGENNKNGNGDTLVSIVPDDGQGTAIHAVFDGTSFCPDPKMASLSAANMLERASILGLIDEASDVMKLIREIHNELSRQGLSSTATIALIKDHQYSLFWVGDSPAVLFKKTEEGHDAQVLTSDTSSFLGHQSFGSIGQITGDFSDTDVLLIQSDGFLNLADKCQLDWLIEVFNKNTRVDFLGFGAWFVPQRKYFRRFEEKCIGGPLDDASVLLAGR